MSTVKFLGFLQDKSSHWWKRRLSSLPCYVVFTLNPWTSQKICPCWSKSFFVHETEFDYNWLTRRC
jgi:hypothetical protein